jgi:hypothetical protein
MCCRDTPAERGRERESVRVYVCEGAGVRCWLNEREETRKSKPDFDARARIGQGRNAEGVQQKALVSYCYGIERTFDIYC